MFTFMRDLTITRNTMRRAYVTSQCLYGIIMWLLLVPTVVLVVIPALPLNLDFLDPTKLQTVSSTITQQRSALEIIEPYLKHVKVEVNFRWFYESKDVFNLKTQNDVLHIRASTGVAAVWGFNYYLKKYCKSQIEWQTKNVAIPNPIPEVDETVVANDRFRYYQNVCTASYSFVWWNIKEWKKHIEWMALNGINLTLAPVAQEAIWDKIYRSIGMTQEEIDKHFTGPAFLSWLRMGNIQGWGGPLPQSWHKLQLVIQKTVIKALIDLGIAPVLPAFNGHVPKAFSRIFPNSSFHTVKKWHNFSIDHCCGLFVNPHDSIFEDIGSKFLNEMKKVPGCHIYIADSFNEVVLSNFNTELVVETARNILLTIFDFDRKAVWLVPNWMLVNSYKWTKELSEAFLKAAPKGRILILDIQSEVKPRYDIHNMYFGHPFIWCMLHNFGGTLGMFGNMVPINKDVYEVRSRTNSSMIGIGLTPEGINQNYVVYDLLLESAWRDSPVQDLNKWISEYAERRHGCNLTADAWKLLLKSVYSYPGYGKIDDIVTKKPSFNYNPGVWYKGADLFDALKKLLFICNNTCDSTGYRYDVVDVTRQVLQYKIDQLYVMLLKEKNASKFDDSVQKFLDGLDDMALILATDINFRAVDWFASARALGNNSDEADLYEFNAWNQITSWGPSEQLNDYAAKQWSEIILYYYRPSWYKFLTYARRRMHGMEKVPKLKSKKQLLMNRTSILRRGERQRRPYGVAKRLYYKWMSMPATEELRIVTTEKPAEAISEIICVGSDLKRKKSDNY